MTVFDNTSWLASPTLLAVICATLTLLVAHAISPTARIVTARWALGALAFWMAGAGMLAWSLQGSPLSVRFWSWHGPWMDFAPAGGLIALLIWTVWYCRRCPVSRRRLCALIMVAGSLWWGLEQWRLNLQPALSDTLAPLTLESLDGRSVTLARGSDAKDSAVNSSEMNNNEVNNNEVINSEVNSSEERYLLLWRSDCRACRQWLQQLAGQPLHPRTSISLINQGEPLLSVVRYLDHHPDQQLGLEDTALLLDPQQRLLAASGSHRLPVLLHRAADGTLTRVSRSTLLIAPALR